MGTRGGRIRSVAAVVLCAVAAVMVLDAAGAARHRTFFTNDCSTSRYRPHHLIATCADATIRVIRIQWTHYGPRKADGHGVAITNNCIPNCVKGKISHDAARVRLRRPRMCSNVGRFQFTHLRFAYIGRSPPVPQRSLHFPFPCRMLSG